MIARIIPLKRLPYSLSHFDYKIPPDLESSIMPGQLVEVPFRSTELFGIVVDRADASDTKNVKELSRIVHTTPLVSTSHIAFMEHIGLLYHISPGTLLKQSILPLQKRKIEHIELEPWKDTPKAEAATSNYIHYSTASERQLHMHKLLREHTLIIVPEVEHINEIVSSIDKELRSRIVCWHAKLSKKEQFERWLQVRNGEKHIVIGTRSALFLPFQNLQHIAVDMEHDMSHKSWNQSPRFHVKDIVKLYSETFGVHTTYMSFSMSVHAYYAVQTGKMKYHDDFVEKRKPIFLRKTKNLPQILNLTREQNSAFFATIHPKLEEYIRTSTMRHQDVFLFINRKGFSPLASDTPEKQYGIGTETVVSEIKQHFEDSPCNIVRIDSEAPKAKVVENGLPNIIVGTQRAFQHVAWERTGLVAYLDVDRQLSLPEYESAEHVWHLIQKTQYLRNQEATFVIQTKHPEHPVFASLHEPDRFYRLDLQSRKQFAYPPYSRITKILVSARAASEAHKKAQEVHKYATKVLTEHKISAKIEHPHPTDPHVSRGTYTECIRIHFDSEKWAKNLTTLLSALPDDAKVDHNPLSLVSP